MAKIKLPEIKEDSAYEKLMEFLELNDIKLEYEVIPNKVIKSDDGLILVASNVPSIKIKAKYGRNN